MKALIALWLAAAPASAWDHLDAVIAQPARALLEDAARVPEPCGEAVSEIAPRLLRISGPPAGSDTITFAHVDTSQDMVPAAPVLAAHGITVEDVTPGSRLMIVNTKQSYEGTAFAPRTSQNALMQIDKGGPVSYIMRFAAPVKELRLLRPKLLAPTPSGITHPQWTARAYDSSGELEAAAGEGLLRSFEDVPAREFVLKGRGITSVRIDSDNRNFAAFGAVIVESMTLDR
jgi:hypothetical protein